MDLLIEFSGFGQKWQYFKNQQVKNGNLTQLITNTSFVDMLCTLLSTII